MPTYASRSLWTSAAAPVFDSATLAWVAAVIANGGTVSGTREQIVDDLIVGLKNDAVWSKGDRLWLFAAENENAGEVDLTAANAITTPVNSPAFTVDRGYSSFAATTYVDTNFNPSTMGVTYTQDSASIAVWVETATSGGSFPNALGADELATDIANFEKSGGSYYVRVNDNTILTDTTSFATGLFTATRTASNAKALYNNTTSSASDSVTSIGRPNVKFFVGQRNDDGTANSACGFTNGRIAAAWMGGALSGTDVANLYARLRTYMTAVGVA